MTTAETKYNKRKGKSTVMHASFKLRLRCRLGQ